jgi:succinate-semialdehyde dehydrogenase/glutarate-semialdehyde dehydrogenase
MINNVVANARLAQKEWAKVPVKTRAAIFLRFSKLVLAKQDQILDVIQEETKKNRLSAFEELLDTVQLSHYYGRNAVSILKDHRRRGAFPIFTKTREVHRPVGVVGVITPWNYPFTLPATDIAPALIAGNSVVLLPDEMTPKIADLMLALMIEAGLPEGLVSIVHGGGRVHGSDLINAVDFVMFTGSTATGRIVAKQCAERLIPFSAELGGKNPMLVLSDADPVKAADGAVRACFANSGQLCVSIERIYVVEKSYDEFVKHFAANTEAMKLGAGNDWEISMGPLISEKQFVRVRDQVNQAVAKGAKVEVGGKVRPDIAPTYFEPTILTNVSDDMDLGRGETFGPVVAIYKVANDAEAVARGNDTEYGLNSSVWGGAAAKRAAEQMESGTVTINEGFSASFASHDSPMGGMKTSGLGRRHGRQGLLKYTNSQTIAVQRIVGIAPIGKQTNRAFATLLTRLLGIWNRIS